MSLDVVECPETIFSLPVEGRVALALRVPDHK
jgi:hypothetical protein